MARAAGVPMCRGCCGWWLSKPCLSDPGRSFWRSSSSSGEGSSLGTKGRAPSETLSWEAVAWLLLVSSKGSWAGSLLSAPSCRTAAEGRCAGSKRFTSSSWFYFGCVHWQSRKISSFPRGVFGRVGRSPSDRSQLIVKKSANLRDTRAFQWSPWTPRPCWWLLTYIFCLWSENRNSLATVKGLCLGLAIKV